MYHHNISVNHLHDLLQRPGRNLNGLNLVKVVRPHPVIMTCKGMMDMIWALMKLRLVINWYISNQDFILYIMMICMLNK